MQPSGDLPSMAMARQHRSGPVVPTYGVFVPFRGYRLTLKRGFRTHDEAVAFLEQIRKLRFHDPDSLFILREPDDLPVPEAHPTAPAPVAEPAALPPSIPGPAVQGTATYAAALAAAIRQLGPTPHQNARNLLRALGLSAEETEAAIAHALAEELVVSDPSDPSWLRTPSA